MVELEKLLQLFFLIALEATTIDVQDELETLTGEETSDNKNASDKVG